MAMSKRRILSRDLKIRAVELLVLFFVLFVLLVEAFSVVNRMFGECIGNYDVTVTDVTYRFGGTAYFTNNNGYESCVDLHNFWIIRSDDDTFIEVGDTIPVKECIGLFGNTYYVLEKDER